jgi:HAD superfamily hydrolase (TIGR01509 family)
VILPSKLKAVLFDIDDTLFDREAAQVISLDRILENYPALFQGIEKNTLWQAWTAADQLTVIEFNEGSYDRGSRSRHFLRLLGLLGDTADDLTRLYLKEYPALKVPMDGLTALVNDLLKYVKIGVVSNSYPDVQYGKIETLGLTKLLSCIVLSEEFGIRKPDPRVFQYAAGLLQVNSSECLFVGDSFSADVIGSKAAGMLACWLNPKDSPLPDDSHIHPDYTINSLRELLPLLKKDGLLDKCFQ